MMSIGPPRAVLASNAYELPSSSSVTGPSKGPTLLGFFRLENQESTCRARHFANVSSPRDPLESGLNRLGETLLYHLAAEDFSGPKGTRNERRTFRSRHEDHVGSEEVIHVLDLPNLCKPRHSLRHNLRPACLDA